MWVKVALGTGGSHYKSAGVQSTERHAETGHLGKSCCGYRWTTPLQCRCQKYRKMGVTGCGYGHLRLPYCLPVTWVWCIV